jgi:hypothetical protein
MNVYCCICMLQFACCTLSSQLQTYLCLKSTCLLAVQQQFYHACIQAHTLAMGTVTVQYVPGRQVGTHGYRHGKHGCIACLSHDGCMQSLPTLGAHNFRLVAARGMQERLSSTASRPCCHRERESNGVSSSLLHARLGPTAVKPLDNSLMPTAVMFVLLCICR